MQPLSFLRFQILDGAKSDLEVLTDTLAIELGGHARELDFAM